MALTLTPDRPQVNGQQLVKSGQIAFDASYTTGGLALTPATLGLTAYDRVSIQPHLGYTFDFDYTNNKVLVYQGDNANASPAPSVQVPNATNLSTLTGVRYEARGR